MKLIEQVLFLPLLHLPSLLGPSILLNILLADTLMSFSSPATSASSELFHLEAPHSQELLCFHYVTL